jgi:hypothetical protein
MAYLVDTLPAYHIVRDGLREEDNNGGGPNHQVGAGDVHEHAWLATDVGIRVHGRGVREAVAAYAGKCDQNGGGTGTGIGYTGWW